MTRLSLFNNPFLVGFDQIEQALDAVSKSTQDSYPPYNIEHIGDARLRISLAVAGFSPDDLDVTVDANQLVIRGKQAEGDSRTYLHRGIATRQFHRKFVLAEGMEVDRAELDAGLLHIDLVRPPQTARVRQIPVTIAGERP